MNIRCTKLPIRPSTYPGCRPPRQHWISISTTSPSADPGARLSAVAAHDFLEREVLSMGASCVMLDRLWSRRRCETTPQRVRMHRRSQLTFRTMLHGRRTPMRLLCQLSTMAHRTRHSAG